MSGCYGQEPAPHYTYLTHTLLGWEQEMIYQPQLSSSRDDGKLVVTDLIHIGAPSAAGHSRIGKLD